MAPIAVITVTYSPGQHIWDFVNSLPAATTQGAHVVMVDNGSTDGAPQAVAAAGKAELVLSGGDRPINMGYGSAMNVGVRHVAALRERGEIDPDFVVIVNPDVVFTPGSIDGLIDAARRYPRAGACGPLIREADGGIYPSARTIPTVGQGIGHALLAGVWPKNPWTRAYMDDRDMSREREAGWLSGSCLLLRWEAFEAIGGFDERYFMYMEDVDLGDRLAKSGWHNMFIPGVEIGHAQGHSADKHPEIVLRAHHESAYRFQADRLPRWYHVPVRWVLRAGLWARLQVVLLLNRRR